VRFKRVFNPKPQVRPKNPHSTFVATVNQHAGGNMSLDHGKTSRLNRGKIQDIFSRLLLKASLFGNEEGAYLDSTRLGEMQRMPQM
jgi:hypothetical protein